MNKLEFKLKKFQPEWDKDNSVLITDIYIDGKNLVDIVEKFEKEKGYEELPGSYVGNFPDALFQEMKNANGNNVPILISAGSLDIDDWPIKMDFETRDGLVIWKNFHQPWRKNPDAIGKDFWDYSDFPTFTFLEDDYKKELNKIAAFVNKK